MTQPVQTPEQHVYLAKLLGYDYTIQYKAGHNNAVADALSRVQESPLPAAEAFYILSIPHFKFLEELKRELSASLEFQTLVAGIRNDPQQYSDFSFRDSLLLHKERLWLNRGNSLIPSLLEEFHKSPLGGHMGLSKTLSRLQQNFSWEGMRKDTQTFIRQCTDCMQTKYITQKPTGLLQPIPPPTRPWEDLAIDFIIGLPNFKGHTVIMTVVDRFSKGAHFGTLPTQFTAHMAAQLFLELVCKLHGFPRSLISDRDPIFISKFWCELFKLSGTQLRMSTSYHPQSDGQTEVLNRVLEQYLRSFVHGKPSQWGKFLSLAEWCYNTTCHSSMNLSPFEITYGKPPPAILDYLPGASSVEAVDFLLSSRQEMFETLRGKLERAQCKMKRYADSHRRDVSFEVGDWVYVRLRPHRQTSIANKYQKLGKRYYGPYQITEVIGKVAYRLALPPTAKIHPVFHCSKLKPHHGPLTTDQSLPPTSWDNNPLIEPLTILDHKWDDQTPPCLSVLVQWTGLPPEDSTWEDWTQLQSIYHLEDKVFSDVVGDDKNGPRPRRISRRPSGWEEFIH